MHSVSGCFFATLLRNRMNCMVVFMINTLHGRAPSIAYTTIFCILLGIPCIVRSSLSIFTSIWLISLCVRTVTGRLVPRSQNDPGSWIRMIHDPWFLEILDPIATVLSKDPKDHRSCPETLSLDLIDLGSCPETLSLDLTDLGSCPETLLLDLIDLGSWTECLSLDPVDLGSWAKHLSWYLKDLGFLDNVSYRSPHGCAPFSLCAATFLIYHMIFMNYWLWWILLHPSFMYLNLC